MAAATTAVPSVVVTADGTEVARYSHKPSAARAARKVEGAHVMSVAAFEAWQDAEAEAKASADRAQAEREAAQAAAVEVAPTEAPATPAKAPKAPRRGQGTEADVRHAALKAQARKLTLPERRALAARVHATVHALLDEMCATAEAGEYAGTDLAAVSAADLEVCAGNWMWHVPGGGLEWGQNR